MKFSILKFIVFVSLFSSPICFSESDITTHDGHAFSTGESLEAPGGGVMMQAFYWDVPAGGTWWEVINSKVSSWKNAGITSIWLPPATKASSPYSMGYDPTDYFDFGEYNQNGSVETRFGSRHELMNLITHAHDENMKVFADIVINHNSGGRQENNPYTQNKSWTNFTQVASGKFLRNYNQYYRNAYGDKDEGNYGGFPDLCHVDPYVQDWLWGRDDSVGKYYKNVMKFDGWRFDYVKGYGPWAINQWNSNVGGFSVGEYWDGNVDNLEWWSKNANSSVFDFAAYYKMHEAFDGNDLNRLNDDMMWKRNPFKAVTFVSNHDTNEIQKKNLAYAYILTHEGFPTIYYRDYEEWLNKDELNNLLWIHNFKATGNTTLLYVDQYEYIARRNGYNGNPGLIVYLNNSDSWKERWILSNWSDVHIKDFSNHSNWLTTTQKDKWVKIQSPPHSYSIWSVDF
jgi:alpha-amylase